MFQTKYDLFEIDEKIKNKLNDVSVNWRPHVPFKDPIYKFYSQIIVSWLFSNYSRNKRYISSFIKIHKKEKYIEGLTVYFSHAYYIYYDPNKKILNINRTLITRNIKKKFNLKSRHLKRIYFILNSNRIEKYDWQRYSMIEYNNKGLYRFRIFGGGPWTYSNTVYKCISKDVFNIVGYLLPKLYPKHSYSIYNIMNEYIFLDDITSDDDIFYNVYGCDYLKVLKISINPNVNIDEEDDDELGYICNFNYKGYKIQIFDGDMNAFVDNEKMKDTNVDTYKCLYLIYAIMKLRKKLYKNNRYGRIFYI